MASESANWRCPLCGEQTRHTREHVIPKQYLREIEDPWVTTDAGVRQQSIIVRVCSSCNKWMNEQLEIPTRPLLDDLKDGRSTVLSRAEQTILAAYMTKHVFMINLWNAMTPDPTLTPAIYQKFRRTMRPPAFARVWIGSVVDADPAIDQNVIEAVPATAAQPSDPKLPYPRGGSCHVMSFYHLVVFWERAPRRDGSSPGERLLRQTVAAGLLERIWSPQDSVRWPRQISFDTAQYGRWSHRFATIVPDGRSMLRPG
jgi:hypothetical protein